MREVVYNKLAMDVRAQAICTDTACLTAGEKAIGTYGPTEEPAPNKEIIKLEKFVITGGEPWAGKVAELSSTRICGCRHSARYKFLAADACVIENLPDISDVAVSLKLFSVLGAKVPNINRNTYEIDTTHLQHHQCADDLWSDAGQLLLPGCAAVPFWQGAGGYARRHCNLGPAIEPHLKVFSALGAEDSVDYGMTSVRAEELNTAPIS